MKPFNLEAAMRGEPIVTRTGLKAKFVAYEPEAHENHRVIFLVDRYVYTRSEKGVVSECSSTENDLFMAPPPMLSINGHEFPEPVREPLKEGQEYWIPAFGRGYGVEHFHWNRAPIHYLFLKQGAIHLTKKDAEAHTKAIILASGGTL